MPLNKRDTLWTCCAHLIVVLHLDDGLELQALLAIGPAGRRVPDAGALWRCESDLSSEKVVGVAFDAVPKVAHVDGRAVPSNAALLDVQQTAIANAFRLVIDFGHGALVPIPASVGQVEAVVEHVGVAPLRGVVVLCDLLIVRENYPTRRVGMQGGPGGAGVGQGIDGELATGDNEGLRTDVAAPLRADAGVGVGGEELAGGCAG